MDKEEENNDAEKIKKYRRQIDIWCRTYSINFDKIELFYDFLISLHELIDDTFLGIDVLYNEEDQRNHFDWCWKLLIDNFSKERIHFKERGDHYEYLWTFFFEAYYLSKIYEKDHEIKRFLETLFDFNHVKTSSELDILTEVYKIFDQNLKK
jgi:hypothetical protein